MRRLCLLLTLILSVSCLNPTKEESTLIEELNKKFNDVEFSPFEGIYDSYVKMRIRGHDVDSTRLAEISRQVMKLNVNSEGRFRTNWVYILVYNEAGDYMFTFANYDQKTMIVYDEIPFE